MSLFAKSKARSRARQATGADRFNFSGSETHESIAGLLNEHMEKQAGLTNYDIFLSHAYDDRQLVLGVTLMIEDLGYSVFLDWRDDPSLDRKRVTPVTAAKLREKMRASKCLFYSITPNEADSAWMKWELGFKDGHNNRTAILPVEVDESAADNYGGQQFLGIYPYVADGNLDNKPRLWIHKSKSCYVEFESWLKGKEPSEHK
jgi:hypothetical protein